MFDFFASGLGRFIVFFAESLPDRHLSVTGSLWISPPKTPLSPTGHVVHGPVVQSLLPRPARGLLELHEATSDVPRLLGAELLEPLAELGYVAVRGTLGARVSVEQWRRRRRRGRRS